MLFEMDDWKMCPYHMELNLFTDTILQVLFKHGQDRHIFLSSFSPDLCIMLVTKQKTYPVLFLNDSSNWPTGDPRALSLQSAVHFARRWELQGVIMASEPFISAPKLIKFVQDQRLFCASYGNLNDDPECAKVWHYFYNACKTLTEFLLDTSGCWYRCYHRKQGQSHYKGVTIIKVERSLRYSGR
jgi:glycerophosphodiester phosphodiesterase